MSVLQQLVRGGDAGRRYSRRRRDKALARLERAVVDLPADGKPVQLVGDYMDAPSYRRWRNQQFKRLPGAFVPPLAAYGRRPRAGGRTGRERPGLRVR